MLKYLTNDSTWSNQGKKLFLTYTKHNHKKEKIGTTKNLTLIQEYKSPLEA